jgi:exopolyphosphatase/pppGpp-phosphohydrolase
MASADVIPEELADRAAALERELREHSVVQAGFDWLEGDLPETLCYHAPAHTADVFSEVILFAAYDNRSDKEIELLSIAAAFHDVGFIVRPMRNEKIGASLARNVMRRAGDYSEDQMFIVETMINDTELKPTRDGNTLEQRASSELSGYLLDADVSNFGRDDFISKSSLVLAEITGKGRDALAILETKAFMEKTLKLLERHKWNTPAARALRQRKKEANIERLRKLLLSLTQAS